MTPRDTLRPPQINRLYITPLRNATRHACARYRSPWSAMLFVHGCRRKPLLHPHMVTAMSTYSVQHAVSPTPESPISAVPKLTVHSLHAIASQGVLTPCEHQQDQQAHYLHGALHPSRTPLMWDVRMDPRTTQAFMSLSGSPTSSTQVSKFLSQPALSSSQISIISGEIPWTISISFPPQRAITRGDLLLAIYNSLQIELSAGELIGVDGNRRREIEQACVARRSGRSQNMRRVDWLAEKTYFLGLVKNEEYARARSEMGSSSMISLSNTWIAVFGSARR